MASWGFVAVLMCGNEAVCVIGCASGQVVLDRSHTEFLGGTKLTNNLGELQVMCCAVLLIEQNRIDDSMRLEIRFDSKYVGQEHLTIVHSSPSVLLVTVRSQTVEANVVVAHSPVEGHERAEDWLETLSELLLSFVNDAPTYGCIDANGRLESPTSKHVGSLSADQETPTGERLHRFLVGADLCAVNTVFCEGDGADKGRPRRIDFVAVSLPEMLRVKKMLGCE